jgi:uncharacterized membrane protein YesL
MWLSRPIYELLPYLYMLIGIVLLGVAWAVQLGTLPGLLMFTGAISLLAGIVLWLRRRDFRSRQAEYDEKSLDL